ncbi:MAG TPA: protease modulator HflK [Candidatus Cybelea sp.]|jgi:membrane protease subunit HflK|nr:protease modulator HflK [Candidatus Cybelea sp.]
MNPQDPNIPPPASAPPAEEASSQALAEAMRSSFVVVQIIMVGLVLVFLSSGFFTVQPQEQAIILRMGKPVEGGRLYGPGLHYAYPQPIEEVVKLRITSLTNADSSVGWYLSPQQRANGEPPNPASKLNPAVTTYALSSDTNIIHVRATAFYRINDPATFVFNFSDAPVFITNALNNALLLVSSKFPVDGILTSNQAAFREQVEQQVRQLIEAEHLGVTVDNVNVDHAPPLYLEAKFNEVVQATQRAESMVKQAQSYANTNVARALGEADTRVKVAEAARKRKVELMASQADVFTNLLAQYERDPQLFKRIRQMNALANVYNNVQEKILEPPNSKEYRFQLSREPREPGTNAPPSSP